MEKRLQEVLEKRFHKTPEEKRGIEETVLYLCRIPDR